MLRIAIVVLAAIAHASAIASPLGRAEDGGTTIVRDASATSMVVEDNQVRSPELSTGKTTIPSTQAEPIFSFDDELILQLRVKGIDATDTIIAYGTRDGLYLPLGELARILDLAIRISDEGHYASGWFLDETRTVTINLREGNLIASGKVRPLARQEAQAFDGELFLRSDIFAEILPLKLEPSLRSQSILLTTLEPFPFEERMLRSAQRGRLETRQDSVAEEEWHREETPWLLVSVPISDVEMRAVADSPKGGRLETDLRMSGDLALMTAQTFFSATTRDGLIASLVQLGRRDADADLLGPLKATEFQFGDVGSASMPVGLRGRAGRGAYITNRSLESASVFEQVDLRGVLPTGYEVELYRNGVLIESLTRSANGQYEFLQVPVDYGLNVFRLVFYGPQGQLREEVKRITVGDGRLAVGELEYEFSAVQRDANLFGVRGPDFRPREGYGNLQATGRFSYGLSKGLTAIASLAGYEANGSYQLTSTAGLRTSLQSLALRLDGAFASDGGFALGGGGSKRIAGGSLTVSHFEYGGGFIDELRNSSGEPLARATELTFNTTLKLGLPPIPLVSRARYVAFQDGRTATSAAIRGSTRAFGMLISNSFEYSSNSASGGSTITQLLGNFDLATFNRSRLQLRGSIGYRLLQGPELSNISAEADYQIDDRTVISAQANYSFNGGGPAFGASAIKEFDRFSVALDGSYSLGVGSYAAALRVGFSFGRDPVREKFYLTRPGQASFGAASVRAFHDIDGDGMFGEKDVPLPDVDIAVFNNVARTDEEGLARLDRLGNGNRMNIQVDPTSLPDIMMAPIERGIEIIPRPGRFHITDFPIVALSEVEGTVAFEGDAGNRGVSGIKLRLVDDSGEVRGLARSGRGGYFFIEQIKPGVVRLELDPEQAGSLGLCLAERLSFEISSAGETYYENLRVRLCD